MISGEIDGARCCIFNQLPSAFSARTSLFSIPCARRLWRLYLAVFMRRTDVTDSVDAPLLCRLFLLPLPAPALAAFSHLSWLYLHSRLYSLVCLPSLHHLSVRSLIILPPLAQHAPGGCGIAPLYLTLNGPYALLAYLRVWRQRDAERWWRFGWTLDDDLGVRQGVNKRAAVGGAAASSAACLYIGNGERRYAYAIAERGAVSAKAVVLRGENSGSLRLECLSMHLARRGSKRGRGQKQQHHGVGAFGWMASVIGRLVVYVNICLLRVDILDHGRRAGALQ